MFETLPGFREFYPEQFAYRRGLFDNWKQSLETCGFSEYDCAVLEPLDLYIEKSGNEIVEQLFHFVDKGDRKVALRPEMTPTLARMVGKKANALRRPVKWFNIGDHFRYERMQKGRTRCFTQLNVDVLGEKGVVADVEAIYSLVLVCKRLGLNSEQFYIRLSDRDVWLLVLEALGIESSKQTQVLGVIDKIERMAEDKVLVLLSEILGDGASVVYESIRSVFMIKSVDALRDWFDSVDSLNEAIQEKVAARIEQWNELLVSLDQLGCSSFYEIDFSIVRGLAYYTGFVFEAFERGRRSRALAGGGRYDHLIKKLGGPDFPAVGWAMGDVTMMDCLEYHGIAPKYETSGKVFVVMEESTRAEALKDIATLREAGLPVVFSYKSAGFGKQFKEANQQGAEIVLVYGSRELEANQVNVKHLTKAEEQAVSRDALLEYLLS